MRPSTHQPMCLPGRTVTLRVLRHHPHPTGRFSYFRVGRTLRVVVGERLDDVADERRVRLYSRGLNKTLATAALPLSTRRAGCHVEQAGRRGTTLTFERARVARGSAP